MRLGPTRAWCDSPSLPPPPAAKPRRKAASGRSTVPNSSASCVLRAVEHANGIVAEDVAQGGFICDDPLQKPLQIAAVAGPLETFSLPIPARTIAPKQQLPAMPFQEADRELFIARERVVAAAGRQVGVEVRVLAHQAIDQTAGLDRPP